MARTNTRTRYSNTYRTQGNVAFDVTKELNAPIRPATSAHVVKNRAKVKKMSLGYVLFLSAALLLGCINLVSYLQMQAQLTVSVKQVAAKESQLNNLRLTNDEELERIESSVNLEEIKRIAVEELGMTYAKEGQVVTISDEGSDYVRQLKELPNN